MKEHIHTIPVMDALRDTEGCPFCFMNEKLEQNAVNFIMGPAYMEDDVRMETNVMGFCASHLKKLYGEQNRLGLALMLHTFMQQLNKDIEAVAHETVIPSFFKKTKGATPAERICSHLKTVESSCYVCRMVERTFARYMDTFFHLWKKDGDEKKIIEEVPGYCLPHFAELLAASESLGKSRQDAFLKKLLPVQMNYMGKMEYDLEWFTLKFDYRNANEPWKNSKDALPRAMAMFRQVRKDETL